MLQAKTKVQPDVLDELYDRSNAILLLGFYLFYVLESIFVLFEPYVRFHGFC